MKIVTATADAQRYIALKHTQPDVKKWTTIEQCNYYFAIFEGKGPFQIAAEVLVKDVKKVADKIRQCILFKKQNTKPYKNERKLLHHFKGLMNIFYFFHHSLHKELLYNFKPLSQKNDP